MDDGVELTKKVLPCFNDVKLLTVHQALSGMGSGIGDDFHPWPDHGQLDKSRDKGNGQSDSPLPGDIFA
ncbi:MAG: hypothetical protein IPP85_16970 [Propionivibrio sp.]|nr:hypothetical protein [Propionivibrio sp.]